MSTTNKTVRFLGFAGVVGAFALLQACAPSGSDGDAVKVDGTDPDVGTSATALTGKGQHVSPPAGYVVKYSTCTYYVESDAAVRNNSRIVNVREDGTVPMQRVEPIDGGKDNNRRVRLAALAKPLIGGTGLDRQTGKKVEFVKLGQVITTKEQDGSVVQWVVGSENLGDATYNSKLRRTEYQDHCFRNPKLAGMDTAGRVAAGVELAATCVVEEMNMEWNALTAVTGWSPLVNYATVKVGTANDPSTRPHPDDASYEGYSSPAYYYSLYGAALNDINGTERDETTSYLAGESYCHMVISSGLEVPGAKRPATKSLPAPGVVNTKTYVQWRPVNPLVNIANDVVAADPVEPAPDSSDAISSEETSAM